MLLKNAGMPLGLFAKKAIAAAHKNMITHWIVMNNRLSTKIRANFCRQPAASKLL